MADRIKDAKNCGLANFPCHGFRANQVWLLLVQLAQNLLCWAQHACLGPDFRLARPKIPAYAHRPPPSAPACPY